MKNFKIILSAAAIICAATPLMASGSGGYGGGYGGNQGNPNQFKQRDPYAEAYRMGKRMFSKRVTCKSCEYSDGVKDSKTASEVVGKIRAGQFELKDDQREAVLYYISKRYSVGS